MTDVVPTPTVKSNKWLWIIGGVVVAGAAFCWYCSRKRRHHDGNKDKKAEVETTDAPAQT